MIRTANIGETVIDDTGTKGWIDALPGEKVVIDAYECVTIPDRCVGVQYDHEWHIVAMKLLKRT